MTYIICICGHDSRHHIEGKSHCEWDHCGCPRFIPNVG